MRRVLISSLTSVAILGHAALGCCWHHSHESPPGQRDSIAHQVHEHGCHRGHPVPATAGHSHFHDVFGDDVNDEPDHDHVPCQDASCTYLGTKSVELSDSPALPASTWLTLALPLTETHGRSVADGAFLCPRPAFPPEHCALIQVWRL